MDSIYSFIVVIPFGITFLGYSSYLIYKYYNSKIYKNKCPNINFQRKVTFINDSESRADPINNFEEYFYTDNKETDEKMIL